MSILEGAEFDRDKFYLGSLCVHGHDWQGTGKSLRYILSNDGCKECGRIYQEKHRERRLTKQRAYCAANAERISRERREYRAANNELMRAKDKLAYLGKKGERHRAHYQENRVRILAERKEYQRRGGTALSCKATCAKRRAQKKQSISGSVTPKTIKNMFERFGHTCAYCGSTERLTMDHLIPLSRGGTNVESNLVSACFSCNSSKGPKDPFEWFQTRPTFSQKRWKFILKLLGKTQSNYNQIPLL